MSEVDELEAEKDALIEQIRQLNISEILFDDEENEGEAEEGETQEEQNNEEDEQNDEDEQNQEGEQNNEEDEQQEEGEAQDGDGGEENETYGVEYAVRYVPGSLEDSDEVQEVVSLIDLLEACWNDWREQSSLLESAINLMKRLKKIEKDYKTKNEELLRVIMIIFSSVGGVRLTHRLYKHALGLLGESMMSRDTTTPNNGGRDDHDEVRARRFISGIRPIWVIGADLSDGFAWHLAACPGYLKEIAEEIVSMFESSKEDVYCLRTSLNLLFHCCKWTDSSDIVSEVKTDDGKSAADVCIVVMGSSKAYLRILALLALAFVVDEDNEDQTKHLSMDKDVETLIENIQQAVDSRQHQSKEGFRLDELLIGAHSTTAHSDDMKLQLMDKGILDPLVEILDKGNNAEKTRACYLIKEIALHPESAKEMREDGRLESALSKIDNDDEADEDLKLNASEALFYLQNSKGSTDENEGKKKGKVEEHIMISYSWKQKETARKIRQRLKEKGYRVWIDIEQMKGYLLDAMANAVENSSAVLVCMSEAYKKSDNCKKEADYANELKKPLIPVKMEAEKPQGWLGMMVAGKKYYDFSGKYDFEETFEDMLKELKQYKK